MESRLSKLEAHVEALVEGLFADHLHPQDLAVRLARALEDSARGGRPPAARYIVRLNASEADQLLKEQPQLAENLAAALVQAAREAHLTLPNQPEIFIVPGEDVKPHRVVIHAESDLGADTSATQGLTPLAPTPSPSAISISAFLILNGRRTVPLDRPVINLGRRADNHLVLEDPSVSRTHAQLRLRFGRYVLYDLGSHAGTYVNGQRVQECVLQPGDILSLGDTQLIYGEGTISQVPVSD